MGLNSSGYVINPITNPCLRYPFIERFTCHLKQVGHLRINFSNIQGCRSIAIKSFIANTKINADYVSFRQNHLFGRNAMHHLFIK